MKDVGYVTKIWGWGILRIECIQDNLMMAPPNNLSTQSHTTYILSTGTSLLTMRHFVWYSEEKVQQMLEFRWELAWALINNPHHMTAPQSAVKTRA